MWKFLASLRVVPFLCVFAAGIYVGLAVREANWWPCLISIYWLCAVVLNHRTRMADLKELRRKIDENKATLEGLKKDGFKIEVVSSPGDPGLRVN